MTEPTDRTPSAATALRRWFRTGGTIYGSWAFIGPIYVRWNEYDCSCGSYLWSVHAGPVEISWRMSRKRLDSLERLIHEADDLGTEWFTRTGELRYYTLDEARASLATKEAT